jgi:hypothetical protein
MVYKYFKWSMILSSFLNAIGSWIRYAAGKNFLIAIFGQELNAISQIWVLETPVGIR